MAADSFKATDEAVDEIIAAYVDALDAGEAPERADWLRRYPEAADALAAFFADQDAFDRRVAPLRECVGSNPAALGVSPFPVPGMRLGDYELLEEIARGGMGIVFKARQSRLNRLVAVKMILSGAFASPAELQRFCVEAESAARLDHPNIVPIYEIETWQGQPYFSMRLIEGGNLAQQLPRYAQDFTAAARLLAQVARGVHYAHQRGILHRDLKPGNILIDADGQPHVTDFGLAKRVDTEAPNLDAVPERSAAAGLSTDIRAVKVGLSTPRAALTQTGMAVGTPSYMAPEQASSATEGAAATTAADVYSLGAILYEMLTGEPPFRGASAVETLRCVVGQAPVPPRSRNAAVPRDLETICLKCLEKDPARRYASAAALADDLERYLKGEPIEARPAGRLERLQRWCRRQPALAAAVLLAFVGLLGVAVMSTLFALSEATHAGSLQRALDEKQAALDNARSEYERAEDNYLRAHEAIEKFCVRFSAEGLPEVPGLQKLQKELMEEALGYYKDFVKQKPNDAKLQAELATTYVRVGDITSRLGSKADALTYYDRAMEIFHELRARNPKSNDVAARMAVAYLNRGVLEVALGRHPQALESYQEADKLAVAVHRANPNDRGVQRNWAATLTNTGLVFRALGKADKSLACFQQARDLLAKLHQQYPEHADYQVTLAHNYLNEGSVLRLLGKTDEAMDAYVHARGLFESAVKEHPTRWSYQYDLALLYRNYGVRLAAEKQPGEGLRILELSRKTLQQAAEANPGVADYQIKLASHYRLVGGVQRGLKESGKALAAFQESYDRLSDLNHKYAGVATYQAELAFSAYDLADMLRTKKETDRAWSVLREALVLRKKLVANNPANFDYRHELAVTFGKVSDMLAAKNELGEAVAQLRQGIDHERQNVLPAGGVADYRGTLRKQYEALASLERRLKHDAAVLTVFEQAVEDFTQSAARQPGTPGLDATVAHFLIEAGRTARDQGQLGPALPRLNQAKDILEKLVAQRAKPYQPALAHCYFQIALTHARFKELDKAIENYERARDCQQDILVKHSESAQTHSSLGTYLHNLGVAYRNANRLEEATQSLQDSVKHQKIALTRSTGPPEARSQLSGSYVVLGDLLRARNRIADAVTVTCERQRLWPKQPKELVLVARDLAKCAALVGKDKQKFSEAEQAERDRIADLGLAALRQAGELGYRDWKEVESGAAFAPLRDRPSWQELLRKYKM